MQPLPLNRRNGGFNMTIGIDMGHTLLGVGSGAIGLVKETDKNREVGKRLITILKEKGHKVVDCTIDKSNNDLFDRVSKANAQHLDLFISLHLNSFNKQAKGVETFIYSGNFPSKQENKAIANRIQGELVKAIGWTNRGVKEDSFYVLKNTKANAILVELGFCDNKEDMDKWDTEKIVKALFKGITGQEYVNTSSTQYRVICGTYGDKDNAIKKQEELKRAGFDSFLVAIK